MRQLVELREHKATFKKLNTEVVAIFREEKPDPSKTYKDTGFPVAFDYRNEKTGAYSPTKKSFDNYVIDKTGKIVAILNGVKTRRATSDQLISVLEALEKGP